MQSTIPQAMMIASPQNKLQPRSFQAFKSQVSGRPALQRAAVRVRAQQQQQQQNKPDAAKFADSIGLPTEEGLFGFKPFPEVCAVLSRPTPDRIVCPVPSVCVAVQQLAVAR